MSIPQAYMREKTVTIQFDVWQWSNSLQEWEVISYQSKSEAENHYKRLIEDKKRAKLIKKTHREYRINIHDIEEEDISS